MRSRGNWRGGYPSTGPRPDNRRIARSTGRQGQRQVKPQCHRPVALLTKVKEVLSIGVQKDSGGFPCRLDSRAHSNSVLEQFPVVDIPHQMRRGRDHGDHDHRRLREPADVVPAGRGGVRVEPRRAKVGGSIFVQTPAGEISSATEQARRKAVVWLINLPESSTRNFHGRFPFGCSAHRATRGRCRRW